jgi:hypothetical protein
MSLMAWSSDFTTDPPTLTVPVGATTHALGPDDASILHHILGEFLAEVKKRPPAPEPPCKGFQWIGQSWKHCDGCGQPRWEHDFDEQLKKGSGPFDSEWEYVPISDERKAAMRAKWEGA